MNKEDFMARVELAWEQYCNAEGSVVEFSIKFIPDKEFSFRWVERVKTHQGTWESSNYSVNL